MKFLQHSPLRGPQECFLHVCIVSRQSYFSTILLSEGDKDRVAFTLRLRQAGHACRACLRQVPGRSGVVWMNLTIVGWIDDVGWVDDGIDSFGKSANECYREFSGLRPMAGGSFLKWGPRRNQVRESRGTRAEAGRLDLGYGRSRASLLKRGEFCPIRTWSHSST